VELNRQNMLDKQRLQQQQFENNLKTQQNARAEKELANATDRTKSEIAMHTAQTAAFIQQQQQSAARFPTLQKEDQLKVRQLGDEIQKSENDQLSILAAAGVDINKLEHITSTDQLTESHAKQAGAGDIFPVANGQEHKAGEDGAGAYLVPGDVWDKTITKPLTITTGWDINPKTGAATPKTTTAQEGTKVGTLLAIAKGAQADLANKQKVIMDQADIQAKRAQVGLAGAEARKALAEAKTDEAMLGAAGGSSVPQNVDPKTGADEAYLKGLPPNLAAEVRAIGEGRVEVNSRMFQSKQGQLLGTALTRAYPGFDQSKAQSYFKMRQDFTSGKTAQAINSYNTAIDHLGNMFDHVTGTNTVQLNNPFSDVHRQLDLDKQLVSTELAKAVSNGSMTEGEKNDILKSISGNTVNSYRTRLQEAVRLLHGKQEAYQEQWNNGAPPGAVSQVPIVSQKADQTISKISGHAATGATAKPATAPPPGSRPVIQNGRTIGYTTDGKTMVPIG